MSADKLTVVHANVYTANKRLPADWKMLEKFGADTVGIGEGMTHIPFFESKRRFRLIAGQPAPDRESKRGAWDTPILTLKKYTNYGEFAWRISDPVEPSKFAPQRWAHVSLFDHPAVGLVAHVNTHTNAVVYDKKKRALKSVTRPHVREWVEAMENIDRLLGFLRADPRKFKIVFTGDLNLPDAAKDFAQEPSVIFKKHRMSYRSGGPDYLAFSQTLQLLDLHKIDKEKTGSDHDYFVADLAKKKRAKKAS